MKAGCESNPLLMNHFRQMNPHIPHNRTHTDMVALTAGLGDGTIPKDDWHGDICLLTSPCVNKSVLKDYNRTEYREEDTLFLEQLQFVRVTRPGVVMCEMTPPHEMCHDEHVFLARQIASLGYDVSVTDRLPTDLCGDGTHRDRWFLIGRLSPVGQLNISQWADQVSTPAAVHLDPLDSVDPSLWICSDLEIWEPWRVGGPLKKDISEWTVADSHPYVTHAYRFANLKGCASEKGTRCRNANREMNP